MIYRSRRALPRLGRKTSLLAATILAIGLTQSAHAQGFDLSRWPDPAEITGVNSAIVSYPSHSPFTLREVGRGAEEDPPTPARAGLFVPQGATADNPVPAVVLLHGAAGVLSAREIAYAGQFAAMGVAALVVDAFGARRDRGTGFVQRLLEVTETMVLADAYSGLKFLDAKPEIDGEHAVVWALPEVSYTEAELTNWQAGHRQAMEALTRKPPQHRGPGD